MDKQGIVSLLEGASDDELNEAWIELKSLASYQRAKAEFLERAKELSLTIFTKGNTVDEQEVMSALEQLTPDQLDKAAEELRALAAHRRNAGKPGVQAAPFNFKEFLKNFLKVVQVLGPVLGPVIGLSPSEGQAQATLK